MKKKVWKSIVCCASMILSLCMFTVHASAAETQAPEPDVYQLSFKAGDATVFLRTVIAVGRQVNN